MVIATRDRPMSTEDMEEGNLNLIIKGMLGSSVAMISMERVFFMMLQVMFYTMAFGEEEKSGIFD